ncbi:hypothetical protein HOY80DRAFT_978315 [Tuber brumale]|nr:hypothetical protein HOY80DRAFT_978315 [Tuber brumale]
MLLTTHLTLLTLFTISIFTVLAIPLPTDSENNVNNFQPTKRFTSQSRVQPPAHLDTNIYQLLEDGTYIAVYNSTTTSSVNKPIAFDIDCDTTDGSPRIPDILEAARRLEERGSKWCSQTNPGGSHCTRSINYESAQIGVCGKFWYYVHCDYLGWSARRVVDSCRWKDYAGGKYIWNENLKAIVY